MGRIRAALILAACVAMTAAFAAPASAQNQQQGLVNAAVEDVIVQVPVAVAANVCHVNVAVLAQLDDTAEACEATADAAAQPGSGPGGGNGTGGANGIFIPIDISIGGFTPLDNNTADDGGQGNIVDPGDVIDPSNLGGLTLLS
jgi:hypothetical protein